MFGKTLITGCIALGLGTVNTVAFGHKMLSRQMEVLDTTRQRPLSREDNPYLAMRNLAFSATPTQLGLELPTDKVVVYGVVVDWEMGNGTATIVAFQTGDASMYFSTGGGIIGGGQHKTVNVAAKQLVTFAQAFLIKAMKTDQTSSPATNEVAFYLLTNAGIYTGKEQMKNFDNGTSLWLPLFTECNNVISAIREVKEKK